MDSISTRQFVQKTKEVAGAFREIADMLNKRRAIANEFLAWKGITRAESCTLDQDGRDALDLEYQGWLKKRA